MAIIGGIQIEVEGKRRAVSGGLKIYGTAEDMAEMRNRITEALNRGLVQGWIGIGAIDDERTVFPFNGKDGIPAKSWQESA